MATASHFRTRVRVGIMTLFLFCLSLVRANSRALTQPPTPNTLLGELPGPMHSRKGPAWTVDSAKALWACVPHISSVLPGEQRISTERWDDEAGETSVPSQGDAEPSKTSSRTVGHSVMYACHIYLLLLGRSP